MLLRQKGQDLGSLAAKSFNLEGGKPLKNEISPTSLSVTLKA